MTPDQQAYLAKYQCRRLTFDGINDLYQTMYGAHTIERALELEQLRKSQPKQSPSPAPRMMHVSEALMRQHLDCVDKYGCGLFEGF